jgi:hypothetical protein
MSTYTCSDANGVHIYPQAVRRCCLICGQRKPFDSADWLEPWPSWARLEPGDLVRVRGTSTGCQPATHPAVVLSTHRGGAPVEVTAGGCEPWVQFITQGADGVYGR